MMSPRYGNGRVVVAAGWARESRTEIVMSFDLAVWDGPVPSTHEEAARVFEGLYRQYLDTERPVVPTPAIVAALGELLARWPDGDAAGERASAPWSWGPMALNASGPLLYFGIDLPRCDRLDVPAFVTELAERHGLIYYDPQSEQVRVPGGVRHGSQSGPVVAGRRGLLTRLLRG
jgi:hypothetical protein